MNDILALVLAAVGGVFLGTLYFGGLWWTLRTSLGSTRIGSRLLVSLLLRSGLCLSGFYIIGNGYPERFLACLLGFFIARIVVIKLTNRLSLAFDSTSAEASHAP